MFVTFVTGPEPSKLPTVDDYKIVTALVSGMRLEQTSCGQYRVFVQGSTFQYLVQPSTYVDLLDIIEKQGHENITG